MHFARNLLQRVPKGHQDMVAAAFRMVFMHPDPAAVTAGSDDTARLLTKQFPRVAELMTAAKTDVLALTAFPPEHWRKVWSNNPLDRLNKKAKRRSNVVRIFSDEASVVRLVGAILAEQHDEWTTSRHYLSEGSMAKLNPERETAFRSAGEFINC